MKSIWVVHIQGNKDVNNLSGTSEIPLIWTTNTLHSMNTKLKHVEVHLQLLSILFVLISCGIKAQDLSLDVAFGNQGKLILTEFDSVGAPSAVGTSDLHTVLAFNQTEDGVLLTRIVKLTENGQYDPTFGTNGVVTLSNFGTVSDLEQQSDGKLLVVGFTTNAQVVVVERYDQFGVLDLTYGVNGRFEQMIPSTSSGNYVRGSLVLSDDKLIVYGVFVMLRLAFAGDVDNSFGNQGYWDGVLINELTNGPNGTLRWIEGNVLKQTDYNAQLALTNVQYTFVNPSPSGFTNKIAVNDQDDIVSTYFQYGGIYSQGFGLLNSSDVSIGTYSTYAKSFQCFYLNAYTGNIYNYAGSYGPIISDQNGNFILSFTRSSHTETHQGYTTYHPLPNHWNVRKIDHSNAPTFIWADSLPGITTQFDSIRFPYASSMFASPDGKLVVAGNCTVGLVNRVVVTLYNNIPDPRSTVNVRVMLGGCYDTSTGLMHDSLRAQGLLPYLAPYTNAGFAMVAGQGNFVTSQAVLDVEGDSAVVDWVWLELLPALIPDSVVRTRVGLLHRNGYVTAADGRSPIDFGNGTGDYFIRVKHRNHLSVTSATPLTLGVAPAMIDFTDPATVTFGTEAQQEVNGVNVLWPGDVNHDDQVKYTGVNNDRDPILITVGGLPTGTSTGYHTTDVNMDGTVKYTGAGNDRDIILQTIGGGVPTAVRHAQVP